MYKVDNAIIMAAGTSSRFAPLSFEKPKALIEVKGEILIERQIKQLQDAGVPEIYIVVGYMADEFKYLQAKYHVHLIYNTEYLHRNNHSSIFAARNILRNSYICSADNYFLINPFEKEVDESYYAAVWSEGATKEWCMEATQGGRIVDVTVGGNNAWYMLGHAFWSETFTEKFLAFLTNEYELPETKKLFWENIFISHINELYMKIRTYPDGIIQEFDSIDELRQFDVSYIENTRSPILKDIAQKLNITEGQIHRIEAFKGKNASAEGFEFSVGSLRYSYYYKDKEIRRI